MLQWAVVGKAFFGGKGVRGLLWGLHVVPHTAHICTADLPVPRQTSANHPPALRFVSAMLTTCPLT